MGTRSPSCQSLSQWPSSARHSTTISSMVISPSPLPSRMIFNPPGPNTSHMESRTYLMAAPGPLSFSRKSARKPLRISPMKVAALDSLLPRSGISSAKLDPNTSCTVPKAKSIPSKRKVGSFKRLSRLKSSMTVMSGRSTITASGSPVSGVWPPKRLNASNRASSPQPSGPGALLV